jgi:hypothetical protein
VLLVHRDALTLISSFGVFMGRHTLKAGVDFETTSYFVRSAQAATYTFQTLAQYQAAIAGKGPYYQLSLTLGNPILQQSDEDSPKPVPL